MHVFCRPLFFLVLLLLTLVAISSKHIYSSVVCQLYTYVYSIISRNALQHSDERNTLSNTELITFQKKVKVRNILHQCG